MEKRDREGILTSLQSGLYELDHESMIAEMERRAKEKISKGLHRPKKKRKQE